MEPQSETEATEQKKMLPPPPGTFQDREDLISHVRDYGASQGYVVTIKKSRKDRRVILGCDRGGVYRNRRKIDETKRKRKACSRLINCPFEAIGKKEDDVWVLTIKNGEHNHDPLKNMSEHPYSRRFSEEEVRQIKLMTEAGVKPRQVLKTLKQTNPELQSTPRHLYNLKAKIRQGNVSEKSFKSWRPNRSVPINASATSSGESVMQYNQRSKVPNFIGGTYVDSQGCATIDVLNPATQEVVSQVPLTTYEEFKDAVNAAKQAFPSWKNTPITTRQRIMFKLQEIIRRDIDKLAMNITIEQGKTLKGARGDVFCGLEVVEQACTMATLQMGEFIPNISNGIDTYCIREPLGVCAGICPFNFPAMIPLWMFPIAVTCGNTFILKASEKNPGASMILAALAMEAGLPDGVLNIVHGTNEIINHICDDDDIKAISFVGSSTATMHIYARAAARGKRIQSNIGGKNYAIIMPDASLDATLNALVAVGFGAAAGQRCMALSTAIFVGRSMLCEDELVELAKALKVNAGTDPSADIGPVISIEVKDQISRLVHSAVESGARLLLDGRNIAVPGYEMGNFMGPTILHDVTPDMECYKEEIFGPVLICMQAESLEEAITIVNKNRFVNGASIFTTSGFAAKKFQNEIEGGLVGINIPVPVPLPFSSSNESKASFAGDFNFCGKTGVQFYTQVKTVVQQWRDLPRLGMRACPPSSETDMRSGGVSSVLPLSSERDSPSQRVSPAMSPASERDSENHEIMLPIPMASDRDLPDPGVSSLSPTANGDLPSRGASLLMSPTDLYLSNREASLAMPPATGRDLSSQGVSLTPPQISERMYMPQTSHWSETLPLTSRRTDVVSPPSERIYMPKTSHRTDTAMSLHCDVAYAPISHKNNDVGPLSHRNDSMVPTHRTDVSLNQSSEKMYMLSTSQLNDSLSQTFQRTERIYTPCSSHRNDHIASTSQRADIPLHPNSEGLYMSATSQRNNNISPATQVADGMPQTTERMYMPPLVQRNAGMAPTSERLSQRMFTQNQMLSMDDFPSQGSSMTLPTPHRI
ncbi:hypothetical protein Dsin_015837 [Dipteronia sinensis]|uniref:methylmalonate-semialdehyde dehydrogenase (CoA acylating) n=1 Tax=Dipteronia sinensis TaxID=43782 RepID=A0AAE0E4X9_9ROSI|nr:hypothetical protein Dsin_015837 [Dipteronia sinensis]